MPDPISGVRVAGRGGPTVIPAAGSVIGTAVGGALGGGIGAAVGAAFGGSALAQIGQTPNFGPQNQGTTTNDIAAGINRAGAEVATLQAIKPGIAKSVEAMVKGLGKLLAPLFENDKKEQDTRNIVQNDSDDNDSGDTG